jgi:DNA-directed RNA polymerase subunit M/transcription elongation factor TFIIS
MDSGKNIDVVIPSGKCPPNKSFTYFFQFLNLPQNTPLTLKLFNEIIELPEYKKYFGYLFEMSEICEQRHILNTLPFGLEMKKKSIKPIVEYIKNKINICPCYCLYLLNVSNKTRRNINIYNEHVIFDQLAFINVFQNFIKAIKPRKELISKPKKIKIKRNNYNLKITHNEFNSIIVVNNKMFQETFIFNDLILDNIKKCNHKNISIFMKQIKSGDENETEIHKCNDCSKIIKAF